MGRPRGNTKRTNLSVWMTEDEHNVIKNAAAMASGSGWPLNAWAYWWLMDQAKPITSRVAESSPDHRKFQVQPKVKTRQVGVGLYNCDVDMIDRAVKRDGARNKQAWARTVLVWASTQVMKRRQMKLLDEAESAPDKELMESSDRPRALAPSESFPPPASRDDAEQMPEELAALLREPATPRHVETLDVTGLEAPEHTAHESGGVILNINNFGLSEASEILSAALKLEIDDKVALGLHRVFDTHDLDIQGDEICDHHLKMAIHLCPKDVVTLEDKAQQAGFTPSEYLEALALALLARKTKG